MSAEKPRRNPDTAFRDFDDDCGIVVVPNRSEVNVVNPVGSRILQLLDGKHTKGQIVGIIADEFEVEQNVARKDLESFLAKLDREGMLAGPDQVPAHGDRE